jgi:hypothetical protein
LIELTIVLLLGQKNISQSSPPWDLSFKQMNKLEIHIRK